MNQKQWEEKIKSSKQIYEQIEIPEELLQQSIQKAVQQVEKTRIAHQTQKSRAQKRGNYMKKITKWTAVTAACAVGAFTIGLNVNPAFAEEMQQNSVLGEISKVLTFRSYEISDKDKQISVNIPQIESTTTYTEEVNEQILEIVSEYEQRATEQIEAYKKAFLETGGTEEEFAAKNLNVHVDYEIKSETDDYVSFVLTAFRDDSKLDYVHEYYNLDLKNNCDLTLKDLLGEQYIELANETILKEIAEDESGLYFEPDMGGFTSIDDDTKFYINEKGNPVIVFEKYEIAAGAAGFPEFEIPKP